MILLTNILDYIDKINKEMIFSDIINQLYDNGIIDKFDKSLLINTAKSEGILLDTMIKPYNNHKSSPYSSYGGLNGNQVD